MRDERYGGDPRASRPIAPCLTGTRKVVISAELFRGPADKSGICEVFTAVGYPVGLRGPRGAHSASFASPLNPLPPRFELCRTLALCVEEA